MKNSYKLIGVFWDRKPIPNSMQNVYNYQSIELDKIINLSDILGLKDKELENKDLSGFDYILVDYIPKVKSETLMRFYTKRLLQIQEFLKAKMIADDEDKMKTLEKYLGFY